MNERSTFDIQDEHGFAKTCKYRSFKRLRRMEGRSVEELHSLCMRLFKGTYIYCHKLLLLVRVLAAKLRARLVVKEYGRKKKYRHFFTSNYLKVETRCGIQTICERRDRGDKLHFLSGFRADVRCALSPPRAFLSAPSGDGTPLRQTLPAP